MKFSEFEYVRISYEEMKKEYETYLSKLKETNDPEEFMKIFNELNKYRGHVDSMRTICSIRHTINTVDEFYDKENEILIDHLAYIKIVGYLRKLHGIKPKIEHAANKTTKRILIQLDRERIEKA